MRLDCGASLSVVKRTAGDLVEAFRLMLGIDGAHHDSGDAGGDQIVHQPLLDGGGGLLGIFQDEGVIGQLLLRLLHARLGVLPEIGGAVDDEGEGLLILGDGAGHGRQGQESGNTGK
jgi:hypothetical protein